MGSSRGLRSKQTAGIPLPASHSPAKTIFNDITMEYATHEAREASFAPPTKRSKQGWPHKTPAPDSLAKAGFYWKPGKEKASKDNVECFMCHRNIGGWEENDNALQEHLTHGSDCPWAILQQIDAQTDHSTSEMEDPTSEILVHARQTTFEMIGWPHEGKKGWTCKTEKMVEAGWYFDPSAESEDYVRCPYCKLSLDGWEPKDNPFEEHHRRSPDCLFFVFAGTTAPSKRPKAKKGRASSARTSKASTRLSTQSMTDNTLLSTAESIPDIDQSIDTSNISLMSTASTATAKGKRKAASKTKPTKSKKAKTTRAKTKEPTPAPEAEVEDDPTPEQITHHPLSTPEPAAISPPPAETLALPSRSASPISATVPSPLKAQSSAPRPSAPTPRSATTRTNLTPTPSPTPSDHENAPPSSLKPSERPPLSSINLTDGYTHTAASRGLVQPEWTPVPIDTILSATQLREIEANAETEVEALISDNQEELYEILTRTNLSSEEKGMTVQEWFEGLAKRAEGELRREAERKVGIFEGEGTRALRVLEGLVCS